MRVANLCFVCVCENLSCTCSGGGGVGGGISTFFKLKSGASQAAK
jgi:hypothetical protein